MTADAADGFKSQLHLLMTFKVRRNNNHSITFLRVETKLLIKSCVTVSNGYYIKMTGKSRMRKIQELNTVNQVGFFGHHIQDPIDVTMELD